MKNQFLMPAVVLLMTIAFAVAPAFTPPFMGYQPGQLPVDYGRAAIQPAGYAFSIWGLIYGWLIIHAGFGLMRRRDDRAWARVRLPLIGAAALGTVWLAIAAAWPLLATATIIVMALLTLRAFLLADPGRDFWLLTAPLSIFAGWLTAASLVSVGIMLVGHGVMSNQASALMIIALAVVLGIYLQSLRPQVWTYGLTLVWALTAIVVVNRDSLPDISIAAGVAALVTLAGTGLLAWRGAVATAARP